MGISVLVIIKVDIYNTVKYIIVNCCVLLFFSEVPWGYEIRGCNCICFISMPI